LITPTEQLQQMRETITGEVRIFSVDALSRLYRNATS